MGPQGLYCGVYGTLPHAYQNPGCQQEVGADPGSHWGQDSQQGHREHGPLDDRRGTERLAQPPARNLQDAVAPVERSQKESLELLVPVELPVAVFIVQVRWTQLAVSAVEGGLGRIVAASLSAFVVNHGHNGYTEIDPLGEKDDEAEETHDGQQEPLRGPPRHFPEVDRAKKFLNIGFGRHGVEMVHG